MPSLSLEDRLRRFDVQCSGQAEIRVHTVQGAILSIFTILLITYLTIVEVQYNFQIILKEEVSLHAKRLGSKELIELEVDLTLPEIPCHHLFVDTDDPNGARQYIQLDKNHHIWKHKLQQRDGDMYLLSPKEFVENSSFLHNLENLKERVTAATPRAAEIEEKMAEDSYCGSCYGLGGENECCHTCDDVERVMKRNRQWISHSKYEQCLHPSEKELNWVGEGCNIHANVAVSASGGNLHIKPGKQAVLTYLDANGKARRVNSWSKQERHVPQIWNVTHTIHSIYFGPDHPNAARQMNGQTRAFTDGRANTLFQYYFQVCERRKPKSCLNECLFLALFSTNFNSWFRPLIDS